MLLEVWDGGIVDKKKNLSICSRGFVPRAGIIPTFLKKK